MTGVDASTDLHIPVRGSDLARDRYVHGLTRDGGPEIHFVEYGSGEPVLLLHGFPDFWYMWHHQITSLAASGHRVIAVDLRGYNRSDAPTGVSNYTIDKLSHDILRVMDSLGILTAHVVGHDWGGVIAWHVAINHPERVRKLVVINAPHPRTYLRALLTSSQALRSWYVAAVQIPRLPEMMLKRNNFRALRQVWRSAGGRSSNVTKDDISRYIKAFSRENRLPAALNYYRAFARSLFRPGKRGTVRASTLLLWGERDKFLVPSLATAAAKWVPDFRLQKFPSLGHWPQLEEPETVSAAIADFLADA